LLFPLFLFSWADCIGGDGLRIWRVVRATPPKGWIL
jgi:hypothetical protein